MSDKIKYVKSVDNMSEKEINKRRKRNGKKHKKSKVIFFIILAILLIFIIVAWLFISSKFNMLQGDKLNEEDLGLNNNIFEDVANTVSKEQFNSIKTIALFGIDEGRSDTVMIASLNPTTKSIKLISIPRDTYVDVQGYGKTKINHAYAYGKEQLAIKTINSNFGLSITEYVTIDFKGLINIINKLGGIELEITKDEKDYINQRVFASYEISGKPVKKLSNYGKVKLTGEQALTHSRNRTVGNDFTRAERQRNVLDAIMVKMADMNFNQMLDLGNSMLSDVKTNIDIPSYIPIATTLFAQKSEFMSNIISVQLPAAEYSAGQTIDGVYYFTTDYVKAKADFLKYIYEK